MSHGHIRPMQEQREMNTHTHTLSLLACARLDLSTLTQFRSPCLGNGDAHKWLDLFTSINLRESIPLPPDISIGNHGIGTLSLRLSS